MTWSLTVLLKLVTMLLLKSFRAKILFCCNNNKTQKWNESQRIDDFCISTLFSKNLEHLNFEPKQRTNVFIWFGFENRPNNCRHRRRRRRRRCSGHHLDQVQVHGLFDVTNLGSSCISTMSGWRAFGLLDDCIVFSEAFIRQCHQAWAKWI